MLVPVLMVMYGACHWLKINRQNKFEGGEIETNIKMKFIHDEDKT